VNLRVFPAVSLRGRIGAFEEPPGSFSLPCFRFFPLSKGLEGAETRGGRGAPALAPWLALETLKIGRVPRVVSRLSQSAAKTESRTNPNQTPPEIYLLWTAQGRTYRLSCQA